MFILKFPTPQTTILKFLITPIIIQFELFILNNLFCIIKEKSLYLPNYDVVTRTENTYFLSDPLLDIWMNR